MRVDRYAFQDPVAPLLARFERAGVADKQAEGLKARWTKFGCVGFAATVAGFFAAAISGVPWLFAVPVLGLAFAIVSFVKANRYGQYDLDDRKLASVRRLLALLRADIPAEWPVAIEVDFRPYNKAGPPVEKTGKAFGAKAARYKQTWLQLRANLADGTALVASLSDHVQRKEKPKRKRTKITESIVSVATVSLRLDKRYGDAAAAASRLKGGSPEPAWRVRFCRGSGRTLKAALVTPRGRRIQNRGTHETGMDRIGSADTLLRMLRWIYGGLPRARAA